MYKTALEDGLELTTKTPATPSQRLRFALQRVSRQ